MSNIPTVTSTHLVSSGPTELVRFEIGLDLTNSAYKYWVVRSTAATVQDALDEQAARSTASL